MNISHKQIHIKKRNLKKCKLTKDKLKKCNFNKSKVKRIKCKRTNSKVKNKKRTISSIKNKCSIKQINYYKIIKPIHIIKPIEVVANDLNIRSLEPTRDKVEIFGSNGPHLLPIRTDSMGRLEVISEHSSSNTCSSTVFREEEILNINVSHSITSLHAQDSSTALVTSYAIVNRGDEPVVARVEISPNAIDYAKDMQEIIPPQTMKVFVPNRFLRWTRVSLVTESSDNVSTVDVYFQSQTTGREEIILK